MASATRVRCRWNGRTRGWRRSTAPSTRASSSNGSISSPRRAARRPVIMDPSDAAYEALKREWTGQYVEVIPDFPELKRFAGIIGRVVTVNHNHKAVVDFQDGGWYDITASIEYLRKLDAAAAKAKFDATINSAQ